MRGEWVKMERKLKYKIIIIAIITFILLPCIVSCSNQQQETTVSESDKINYSNLLSHFNECPGRMYREFDTTTNMIIYCCYACSKKFEFSNQEILIKHDEKVGGDLVAHADNNCFGTIELLDATQIEEASTEILKMVPGYNPRDHASYIIGVEECKCLSCNKVFHFVCPGSAQIYNLEYDYKVNEIGMEYDKKHIPELIEHIKICGKCRTHPKKLSVIYCSNSNGKQSYDIDGYKISYVADPHIKNYFICQAFDGTVFGVYHSSLASVIQHQLRCWGKVKFTHADNQVPNKVKHLIDESRLTSVHHYICDRCNEDFYVAREKDIDERDARYYDFLEAEYKYIFSQKLKFY